MHRKDHIRAEGLARADLKKHIPTLAFAASALVSVLIFALCWHGLMDADHGGPVLLPPHSLSPATVRQKVIEAVLPSIQPRISQGTADVMHESGKVFAYAHATLEADGKLFIGMSGTSANTFPTNNIVIFGDLSDISLPTIIALPVSGEIGTMVYDKANDRIYFESSGNGALKIYALDPHTYGVTAIVSTTTVDGGRRPAIVTDGAYIYGITNTEPSVVFRVSVHGGGLALSREGHIPNGHSAAIGRYASTTELYFGGGMLDGFEKTDAATLAPLARKTIAPCSMSDDMPFVPTGPSEGHVYIGCEMVPYGIRVRTGDMSFERFSLPGASLGLFTYGSDIYNAAQDGNMDVFPGGDLKDLRRYHVANAARPLDTKGQDLEVNEIMYAPATAKLYLTAWYGVPGLYQVSTSTLPAESFAILGK